MIYAEKNDPEGTPKAKIIVNAVSTKSHAAMTKLFKRSYLRHNNLPLLIHECPENTSDGRFRTQQWFEAIDYKLDLIVKSVLHNMGKLVVWSDVDILFFKPIKNMVLGSMRGKHLCGMSDRGDINGGFHVTYCCNRTLKMWRAIQNFPRKDRYRLYDQPIINEVARNVFPDIKCDVLPMPFFSCTHMCQAFTKDSRGEKKLNSEIGVLHFVGKDKLNRMSRTK